MKMVNLTNWGKLKMRRGKTMKTGMTPIPGNHVHHRARAFLRLSPFTQSLLFLEEIPFHASDSHRISNLRRTMTTMTRMTAGISHGMEISHIPPAEYLAAKVLALRAPSGVPFHAHQNPLVSPVHLPMQMDKYLAQATSRSHAAEVSTALVQPVVAQVFIVRDL
jgi:hypothetical protein